MEPADRRGRKERKQLRKISRDRISGKKKEIHLLGIHDFIDQEEEHYGLKGSATRVKKIFPPERTKRQDVAALERKEAAEYILNILAVDRQEEQR